MNSTEKMLRLQGGYRNTKIPYDIEAIKNQIEERNKPAINLLEIKKNPYRPIPKEYRSFNEVRDTNDEMANYYIEKLKYYKDNDEIMYEKTTNYILRIINSDTAPVSWVVTVYKWIVRNNY